jgi:hypothetical protein
MLETVILKLLLNLICAVQIIDVISPDGNEGGRLLGQEDLDTDCISRTAGNDVINVEYTCSTGTARQVELEVV